jgi:hypothetical protein
LGRGITQVVYDGGEEETECIDRQAQGMGTEAVEIDLWVLECLNNAAPGKLFVPSSVAVIPESRENAFPLFGSEKLGGRGVIVDEEISSNGNDNSE